MRRNTVLGGLVVVCLVTLILLGCGGGGGYGGGGGGGNIPPGTITTIAITPTSASVAMGSMQQFKAVAMDANGNTVQNSALVWASSNTAVATVDNSGLATAKAAGSTQITASITYSGGYYGMGITYTSNNAMLTVTAVDTVMGTAATGKPLAGALISLMDARGRTESAVSGPDGHFQLSTAGLSAPFLLKADDGRGRVLYGAATQAGMANIDTLTDVMLRAWYGARGTDPAAAFAAHSVPDGRSLAALDQGFTGLMQGTLESQGLDAAHFSLLSTPFDADSKGFDHILDNTRVSSAGGKLSLADGLAGTTTEITPSQDAILLEIRAAGMPQLTSMRRIPLP
ncbi:MAG TPA: Ig-like domain-containing protein [Gammaproteobacteria bacterium]|nr:Ig-like domain-containing protein [Gammaproteobacteria bacterium]